MPEEISKAEKIDIILALALAFESIQPNAGTNAVETAEKFISRANGFLPADDASILRRRAAEHDRLADRERRFWKTSRLNKIKRRGRSTRLDALVHPSQIVSLLKSEPKNVQDLIIRNLPTESQLQIAAELKIKSAQIQNNPVREDVLNLVRQNFLHHFVTLEDVYEPTGIDRFTYRQLQKFVLLLGIRETAIACRGIKSKESLAVFLNRFDRDDSHEIARFIAGLDKIKPVWVAHADRSMREMWTNNIKPHEFLTGFGLKLFALACSDRDRTAQKFTAQKMTVAEAERWLSYVESSEAEFAAADAEERSFIDRRRKIIQKLAEKFAQTEDL